MDVGLMVSGFGVLFFACYSVMFTSPEKALKMLESFPRSRIAGVVLSAIAVVWSALLLYSIPLGWFDAYKQSLYILAPVLLVLVVKFMDDLLASRSLGAVLLLIPSPILKGIRFHESPLRLVVVLLCYSIIICGIALVLSPYKFRKTMELMGRNKKICKYIGLIGIMLGVFLMIAGLFIFGGLAAV